MERIELYISREELINIRDFILKLRSPLDPEYKKAQGLFELVTQGCDLIICDDSMNELKQLNDDPFFKLIRDKWIDNAIEVIRIPNFKEDINDLDYLQSRIRPIVFDSKSKIGSENGILIYKDDFTDPDLNDLSFNHVFIKQKKDHCSWKELFEKIKLPINSAVIADNYLLRNKSDLDRYFIPVLDAILPETLESIDFHLTFIGGVNGRDNGLINKDFFNEISAKIKSLRGYPIKFSLYFTNMQEPHDRDIISNYYWIAAQHGFNVIGDTIVEKDFKIQIHGLNNYGTNMLASIGQLFEKYIKTSKEGFDSMGSDFKNRLLS